MFVRVYCSRAALCVLQVLSVRDSAEKHLPRNHICTDDLVEAIVQLGAVPAVVPLLGLTDDDDDGGGGGGGGGGGSGGDRCAFDFCSSRARQ